MNQNKIEWNFKAINPCDYECQIEMNTTNRLLLMVFNKSKKKLAKKNINVKEQIENIEKFPIDQRYLNLVKTFIRPVINNIYKDCKKDNMEILSSNIKEGNFERNKNRDWKITIILTGQYADKR